MTIGPDFKNNNEPFKRQSSPRNKTAYQKRH
jgi:hypothetical protein